MTIKCGVCGEALGSGETIHVAGEALAVIPASTARRRTDSALILRGPSFNRFVLEDAEGTLHSPHILPGVGPALAHRLLCHFGSVERVLTADAATLAEVRGIGAKKAARIRELVC